MPTLTTIQNLGNDMELPAGRVRWLTHAVMGGGVYQYVAHRHPHLATLAPYHPHLAQVIRQI